MVSLLLMAARARVNHISSVPTVPWLTYMDSLSPVAHWRMDDAVGSAYLNDRVANEHATLNGVAGSDYTLGATGMIAGDADTAVNFSSGYAATGAAQKWSLGTEDYSFFLIAKWNSTVLRTALGCRDSGATNILASIFVNRASAGDIGIEGANYSTAGAYFRTTDKPYNDGKPHAIGLTYDATTQAMKLYVDGVFKGSNSVAIPRPSTATMRCTIAGNFNVQLFQGVIDEVALFDHKLADADMATLASYKSST